MVITALNIKGKKHGMRTYSSTFQNLFIAILLLPLLSLTSMATLAASLTASVDRNQLGAAETLELRIKYDEQTSSDPDFSPLEKDFEILSKNQQNQFSFTNGNSVSYTEWRIQLLPKRTGKLTIPVLQFKGGESNLITLQVTDKPSINKGNQPVFIETELNKNAVYVQEQLLLTLRILATTNLQGISSEDLIIDNASFTQVSKNQFQKQINGVNHLVIELKYAVFPNASGELTIPALRFDITLPDRRDPFSGSFFSRGGKRVFLYSDEQTVTVNPKPTSYGPEEWLPSQGISLSERWSRSVNELVAGEPITRTIQINTQGLTSAQLPPLAINAGDGFKIYPDQPQLNDEVTDKGVRSTRIESVAIVPSRGGEISLPPITIKWWDTASNQVRETKLNGTTLTVKPAVNSPEPLPASQPISVVSEENQGVATTEVMPSNLLLWLLGISNLVMLGLVIFLLVLWRRAQHQQPPLSSDNLPELNEQKESAVFKQLKQCVKTNDHRHFRETLISWANLYWQQPIHTLNDIAEMAATPSLRAQLEALDQALYRSGNTDNIELDTLYDELKALRKESKEKAVSKGKHLKPLYDN